jgi:hypothetical protein
MEYSALVSFKTILKLVALNNGLYTWYNIVKTVDQIEDIEKCPPTYEVLKELTRIGYLQTDSPESENDTKYSITQDGLKFLKNDIS